MNRFVLLLSLQLLTFVSMLACDRAGSYRNGGRTLTEARLVTEKELEEASLDLPFFLAVGADEEFNYYQLREYGYFKTNRSSSEFKQPKNSDVGFGLASVGSGGVFVTMIEGRLTIPKPSSLNQENIAAFAPYLHDHHSRSDR